MFDKYYNYGMAIPKIAPENKVMLTVEEACGVFGIGEHTLRNLIRSNPRATYLLHVGTKTLIKRPLFEQFVLGESALHY